jgi:autotransporter-associated beta strand protein
VATTANWNSGNNKFNQGDNVTFDNTNTGSNTVTINTTVQPTSVAVNGSHSYIFNGTGGIANVMSGTTALTQTGTGTLTISTNNTYTGATTVGTGSDTPTLTLTSAGKIASTSVVVNAGATGNINGLLTGTPSVTANGHIVLGANDGTNGTAGAILVRNWGTLNVAATTGNLSLTPATTHAQRQLLVLNSASANPLTNSGKIDLANNDMIVQHGNTGSVSTVGSIANQLKTARNAATYFGGATGITSSTAAGDSRFLTTLGYHIGGASFDPVNAGSPFDGVNTTATDVLIKYTYYGDANLDGKVNGADYALIDTGFGTHATGWAAGDFNYDGVVDGTDYSLIDNTFNQISATGATPLAIIASPADLIASPATTSAVPEPTTLGLLGIGAIGLLSRRRRRSV